MIKPEFWNDEKLGNESEAIQLTYIGTWNFSDDYGVVRANPVWLKSQLFPYKQHLRIDVFSKWLEALERMEMLIRFTVRSEQYYFIRTFRLHQSVDKPSKSRNCSEEELVTALESLGYKKGSGNDWVKVDDHSESSRVVLPDKEKRSISKENRAKALVVTSADEPLPVNKSEYKKIQESFTGKERGEMWTAIKTFIETNQPDFIEPYADAWNLFASAYKLAEIRDISDSRRKKFGVRIREESFHFIGILEKIKSSAMLKGETGNGWKVSFDWILENDKNYLKILEGNYN